MSKSKLHVGARPSIHSRLGICREAETPKLKMIIAKVRIFPVSLLADSHQPLPRPMQRPHAYVHIRCRVNLLLCKRTNTCDNCGSFHPRVYIETRAQDTNTSKPELELNLRLRSSTTEKNRPDVFVPNLHRPRACRRFLPSNV